MKRHNKWTVPVTALTLVIVCLLGGVAMAATTTAGGKTDPLVSYSYFTEGILVNLLDMVEDKADGVADDLREDFDGQISEYTDQMETLVAEVVEQTGGNQDLSAASYSVISLEAGATMTLNAGDEVMLRIGSATISGGTPALIDTTGGTELADGGSLVTNHLYLTTMDGRTLTAGNSTIWILVRQ